MTDLTVLVIDDRPEEVRSWADRLRAILQTLALDYDVQELGGEGISDELKVLRERRRAARDHRPSGDEGIRIDGADVVVVDWDLVDAEVPGLTGSDVAYLARCYSLCGLIVLVNPPHLRENRFDLSADPFLESFADVHLGDQQLDNVGLWGGNQVGFRDWSWPNIPDAVDRLRRCEQEVLKHPDEPILQHLGLMGEMDHLARVAARFITIEGERARPEATTFRQFVEEAPGGLTGRDRKNASEESIIARVAAGRITRWLNAAVLPRQEFLVDAPHLLMRFPSLLAGDPTDRRAWDSACDLARHDRGADAVDPALADVARFQPDRWLWRPAWLWPTLLSTPDIPENEAPWDVPPLDWLFCEDLSRFLPDDETRRYVVGLDSRFRRRFVSRPDSGTLQEALSSLERDDRSGAHPARVIYRPPDLLE